jgi:energy-coupling factor transporter ATP-binding protein EcfA2
MNISYNWLKNYLKTDLSAEKIAEILTDIGLEVEEFEKIETIRGGLAGVVVGQVLTCVDHPDSDHLHVTTVDVGADEPLNIVCGAPNVRAGLKVLCATIGAVLYPMGETEGFKIKKSKIPYYRRTLGYVFQEYKLFPNMTVFDNVAFAMHVIGEPNRRIKRRVTEFLKELNLDKYAD